jgi:hypothetical protein
MQFLTGAAVCVEILDTLKILWVQSFTDEYKWEAVRIT